MRQSYLLATVAIRTLTGECCAENKFDHVKPSGYLLHGHMHERTRQAWHLHSTPSGSSLPVPIALCSAAMLDTFAACCQTARLMQDFAAFQVCDGGRPAVLPGAHGGECACPWRRQLGQDVLHGAGPPDLHSLPPPPAGALQSMRDSLCRDRAAMWLQTSAGMLPAAGSEAGVSVPQLCAWAAERCASEYKSTSAAWPCCCTSISGCSCQYTSSCPVWGCRLTSAWLRCCCSLLCSTVALSTRASPLPTTPLLRSSWTST